MSSTAVGERIAPAPQSRTIRVASVPSGHVYVRHLAPERDLPGFPRIERLLDPDPDSPDRPAAARWWPPAMLEASWVRENRDFDVLHLQFGFDARTPEQLQEWVDALHDTGRPLVYTVHDLRNPHHETRGLHDAQLDVLIHGADALITLTPGAAAEIRQRWGRDALVLPHPHVVDFDTMRRFQPRPPSAGFRVGVHVKSLRASMDPLPVIRTLCDALSEIPGSVLQVNGHRDVLLEDGDRYEPELTRFVREAHERGAVDLRVHDFMDDDALWQYLASLDVSVLPYRFGTHSGWLEACHDLGTSVVAPTCGYFRDQGEVFVYRHDEDGLDTESLVDALLRAHAAGPRPAYTVTERRTQRRAIAAAHASLYDSLVS